MIKAQDKIFGDARRVREELRPGADLQKPQSKFAILIMHWTYSLRGEYSVLYPGRDYIRVCIFNQWVDYFWSPSPENGQLDARINNFCGKGIVAERMA